MAKFGMLEVDSEEVDPSSDGSASVSKRPKVRASISILIESLVKNLCAIFEPDNVKAQHIYTLICAKLFEMNLIDESYSMVEFESMRNQYQRALFHLVSRAVGGKAPVPMQPLRLGDVTSEWSHYHREFDEIEYIAGGGFGQVFRAKHKLDGTEYAVKKIFIRSEGIQSVMNYLSEVKTFASLNDPNIVQYKAAWLELGCTANPMIDSLNRSVSSECDNDHESIINLKPTDEYIYPQAILEAEMDTSSCRCDDSSDFAVTFESAYKDHPLSLSNNGERRKNGRNRIKRNSVSEGDHAICCLADIEKMQVTAKSQTRWATLYIQMALCQTTLKQWIETRNQTELILEQNASALMRVNMVSQSQVHMNTVMEILKQLLRGIKYIHSKGIVHHDIKPSNIFVQIDSGKLLVQLGDFGLACPLQSARHSLAFGTKLYAAPEQLLGKCNPKSDMYALGIVLLELVETFNTDMERVETINELRKGHIPKHVRIEQPKVASVIAQLVSRLPEERPDATALLATIADKRDDIDVIENLRGQLAKKDEEIRMLKELLQKAGVEHASI